jgi:lipopolysaccharide export system permease protein
VLFLIMGFRLPGFLQLILPLGLFLGILLAYGRLYLESEMTVLSATGMSQQRLLGMTMAPAALVALLVAWLSLSLAPLGVAQVQQIIASRMP